MLKWIIDFFFPSKCPFCGKIVPTPFQACGECALSESKEFFRAGEDLWCYAPFWYEGLVREGILRYKFEGLYQYATAFGGCMSAIPLGGEPFDLVTWVPLAAPRLRQRGYDQAELLAKVVAERYGLPLMGTLVKIKDTKPQSSLLEATARFENAKDVYILADVDVSGANILLIDDVITTGASTLSCAETLKTGGARGVACLSLARAKMTKDCPEFMQEQTVANKL